MDYEIEQKFRAHDLAAVRAQLERLGARFVACEQADRYYSHPARNFAKTDEALRLRQVGEENFVTYKGPRTDRTTKTRQELELPLPPGAKSLEDFSQLLVALGFTPVATVQKVRQSATIAWDGWQIEASLDEVAYVGTFIELEIIAAEQAVPAAKLAIGALAARLGLGESEHRSYLELLLGSGA